METRDVNVLVSAFRADAIHHGRCRAWLDGRLRRAAAGSEGRDLPVPVRRWHVKEGVDATDEAAVWIWAYVEGDDIDADADFRLKSMARQVVRDATGGLWPYVLIRSANEPEP